MARLWGRSSGEGAVEDERVEAEANASGTDDPNIDAFPSLGDTMESSEGFTREEILANADVGLDKEREENCCTSVLSKDEIKFLIKECLEGLKIVKRGRETLNRIGGFAEVEEQIRTNGRLLDDLKREVELFKEERSLNDVPYNVSSRDSKRFRGVDRGKEVELFEEEQGLNDVRYGSARCSKRLRSADHAKHKELLPSLQHRVSADERSFIAKAIALDEERSTY